MREMLAKEWQTIRQLRYLAIDFDPDRCTGTWQCYEVCPIGCWEPDYDRHKVDFVNGERCIACGACVLQCKPKAIELKV